ncbi:glycoside hydrolase family 108 protein [Tenacibaculum sp. 190130A14a]|uniref:Predicted Peptidoglycan domain-containing protein n=1 Tax=Tenacibaculum polynesiense TaxID=3137857 RepID=A0ABP1F7C4_9FLAO
MANYNVFKPSIELAEGGYQNLKNDKGNYNSNGERVGTNHGVSAKFYERVIGFPPSVEDMKNITKAESHLLFKNEFWDKMRADEIHNQGIAEVIVDHAINANPRVTGKIVQRTLNKHFGKSLAVDGVVGNQTLAAINTVNPTLFFEKIADARIAYYKSLSDYQYFGRSWTKRVVDLAQKFGVQLKKKQAY